MQRMWLLEEGSATESSSSCRISCLRGFFSSYLEAGVGHGLSESKPSMLGSWERGKEPGISSLVRMS